MTLITIKEKEGHKFMQQQIRRSASQTQRRKLASEVSLNRYTCKHVGSAAHCVNK